MGGRGDLLDWRRRAARFTLNWRNTGIAASNRVGQSLQTGFRATTSVAGDVYTSALNWKNNSEFSAWLTDHFSNQRATIATKAMDAEYLRSYVGGNWHRLYDGGHTLGGSWRAVKDALPDLGALDQLGTWANAYWQDLITARGMPIIVLDHANQIAEYFRHLDSVNVAELLGGNACGVSVYCNWNDPAKLVASATATDCASIVYANVIAPLIGLIGLGRAYFIVTKSEQNDLQQLIAPALKGLSRGGATVLLITVIPGGFLIHLSSGIVIALAHGYLWDKGSENKEAIFATVKAAVTELLNTVPQFPLLGHASTAMMIAKSDD